MEQTNSNNHSSDNMPSDFYSFSPQSDRESMRKTKAVRVTVCAQVTGVALFCVGLVVGLLIGIYGFNGTGKNEAPHSNQSPTLSKSVDSSGNGDSHSFIDPNKGASKNNRANNRNHDRHEHGHSHAPKDDVGSASSTRDSQRSHKHPPVDLHGHNHAPENLNGHDQDPADQQEHVHRPKDSHGHDHTPVDSHGHDHTPVDSHGHDHTPVDSHGHGHTPVDSHGHDHTPVDSHGHGHTPVDSHGHASAESHGHSHAHGGHDHPHSSSDSVLKSPNIETTLPSTDTGLDEWVDDVACVPCKWTHPVDGLTKLELFAPINSTEMIKAREALYREGIITIKPGQELAFNESYVQSMYLFPPNKTEALAYLDADGAFPGRYVTVMVVEGASEEPQLMKYKVGPLEGDSENITAIPLLKPNEVPFSHRPYDAIETREVIITVMSELNRINPMMQESFDSRSPYIDMSIMPNGPFIYNGERTSRWTAGLRGIGDKDFDFLNVVPLNGLVYHGGQDPSKWRVYNIFYLNQGPFNSVEDLYKAYKSTSLYKIQYPKGTRDLIKEVTFPKRRLSNPLRPNSHRTGTKTVEPTGPRYRMKGHDISWLGWEFSVTTSQHRGPAVFNVKFRGERVVYENALNDIGLLYSADGSGQDNIFYTDSTFGLGASKVAISEIDCPSHAAYIKSVMWNPVAMRGSERLTICIFEMDAQEPLYRHKGDDIEVGMRNRYLVARYPTQLGNYDYLIDFQFHLDGKIVTTATATGFIQASYLNTLSDFYNPKDPGRTPFGYRVSNDIIGPIHDHTFSFKVDLDVVSEKNDFELIHWKYGNVMDALRTVKKENMKYPNYFFHNQTRFVEWEHVQNETVLDIDSKHPKFWTFLNNNVKNFWKVSRGYRLVPMHSGTQNIENDHPDAKHLSFTQHHLTVTKRKENEQYVKPIYNPADTKDPEPSRKYVDDMVDGESIENTDIVAWVALGFLHIPTSEDVPMTTKVTSGFTLKPFNFFDTTAVFDMPSHAVGVNKTVFDSEPEEEPCQYIPLSVQG
ncbi:amiloride-sensitive amine oxidase [copper-containing]-like isoform X1 [Ostrea edulis]|nr:amiloride-sensitive amine oxidase [copper-containing]-like isoform X1 [Ostrea edulis]XP_056016592.1 amiloride-sensitive amine oxidase [copper-containing]-like isoform X1 [Ostrea edulis]